MTTLSNPERAMVAAIAYTAIPTARKSEFLNRYVALMDISYKKADIDELLAEHLAASDQIKKG